MSLRFINREPELDYLNQVFKKQRSSMVIIYGRRRIGKTTLIKEFIRNKKALYLMQLKNLKLRIKRISRMLWRNLQENLY